MRGAGSFFAPPWHSGGDHLLFELRAWARRALLLLEAFSAEGGGVCGMLCMVYQGWDLAVGGAVRMVESIQKQITTMGILIITALNPQSLVGCPARREKSTGVL